MRAALHTRVRADRVAAYEAGASGAERGGGTDLATWQARMAELLDVPHDYSREGADAGLPVVGELP
ncbi:hypothetical protein [Streptomyces sp. NPDC002088]|uniref:hypothetical protein n=1 Tax=Streptomyces sp. NPDC002088 TaxID=3154665 RepID=UPI00332183D2